MNTGKTYKTRQRAEIESVLRDGDCMTVRDICARLASAGANVGETTVYRTLEKMAAEGDVRRYDPGKGAAVYRLADDRRCDGHVHLRCLCCGALEHLDCGFIRRMEAHIEKEHGFTLDGGRTVLYGSAAAAERSGRNETCFFASACAASACAAAGRLHCGAGGSRGRPADCRDQLPAVRLARRVAGRTPRYGCFCPRAPSRTATSLRPRI
ncbi:MAG: Fur family transcriptional regulator [Acutalibacteraceae bacterium]